MKINKKITIKEIMTKDVVTVTTDTSVPEVANLLSEFRYHGVPVMDKGRLAGIITETDFFIRDYPDLYLPSYIDFLKKTKFHKKLPRKKKKETNKLLKAKAKDIMSENVATVNEDQDIADLVKIYQSGSLYSIPVIDKNKNMVGIVTQSDIIKLIKLI